MRASPAWDRPARASPLTGFLPSPPPFHASTGFFNDEPEHWLVRIEQLTRVTQVSHQRRDRLARRVVVGRHLEHLAGVHLFQREAGVNGRTWAHLPAQVEATMDRALCHG